MKTSLHSHVMSDQRGSVLLVALILAAVIAISLTSYMGLATNISKLSYRSHYAGVAMNTAESGLEQAMWSINKKKDGVSTAWDGWDITSGTTARRTFSLGTVSGGGTVSVKVLVSDRNLTTTNPYAIARAIVTPVKGAVIEKWIKISLYQRSRFSNGLVAKDGITFSGNNAYVDSYNSANGSYSASPATTNRFARGSAGSASVAIDSLSVGNADIYGYASIGTSNYDGLDVGSQGKVTGDFNASSGTIDYSHVATSFTANFEAITAPATSSTNLGTVSSNLTLPSNTTSDAQVTATDGTITYYYNANSISLTNKTLTISPGYNVVVTVTGDISLGGGSGAIVVNSTKNTSTGVTKESSLNLYVAGNVTMGGQGAANTLTITGASSSTTESRPKNLIIWGTATTSQTIKVSGNGSLSAVVYAPNAAIEAKGGGSNGGLFGSFIGKSVKMTGNEGFHYDESLRDLDSGEPLGIDKWDEFVSTADRTSLGTLMNF